jgi:hypothetical protein
MEFTKAHNRYSAENINKKSIKNITTEEPMQLFSDYLV